jgi:acetyl esterase/lipase
MSFSLCNNAALLGRLSAILPPDRSEEVISRLTGLSDAVTEFSAIASHYDYSPSVPANGFRSFLKILQTYFETLTQLTETQPNASPKQRTKAMNDFLEISPFLMKQVALMRLVRSKDLQKQQSDCNRRLTDDQADNNNISFTDEEILLQLLSFSEADLMPLFSSARNFWMSPENRRVMDVIMNHSLAKSLPVHQLLMTVFDSNTRKKACARYSLSSTVHDLKSAWSLLDEGVGRAITTLRFLTSSGHVDNVLLPRITSHSISKTSEPKKGEPVEAILISYNDKEKMSRETSLILHAAGGGFVAAGPRSHESYMRCWSKNLGVPIICPDYGKAPEHPFPEGLQDILDAYLYISSGASDLMDVIGFQPENIILSGESAGGNLALALLLVLNDLRKEFPEIRMPKSVCLFYPAANASIQTSPSRSFVTFDPILTIAATFGIGAAYPGLERDAAADPWFRRDLPDVLRTFKEIVRISEDPYFNPLHSDKWHEMSDIPLSIQMCEFDPLLDDSIAIARAWRGPVRLSHAAGKPHGYLTSAGQRFPDPALHASIDLLSESIAALSSPKQND